MLKCIILLKKDLTDNILRDCMKSRADKGIGHNQEEITDEYFNKYKDKHYIIDNNDENVVIFYNGTKPNSCKNYATKYWNNEKDKPEWKQEGDVI